MTKSVHIFDVCGTLFLDNTTAGLLRWYHKVRGNRVRSIALELLYRVDSPLSWVVKVVERVSGVQLAKNLAVSTLRGELLVEVEQEAERYVDFLLAERAIPELLITLRQCKREDKRVVLASASINPIIRAVGFALEVPWVSSHLEEIDGRLTGRLTNDISGKKIASLIEVFGEGFFKDECFGYSDNFSDRELLKLCRHKTVVLHKRRHRGRWDIPDARFIELYQDLGNA